MQKTSLLFWILGMTLTLLGVYESLFPSSPGTLFIRLFGLAALLFTCVSLMIGPLAVMWPARFAALIEPRRAVGLTAFVFMLAHFLLVIIHTYAWQVELVLESLETLIAIPAFVLFTLIALVSSDYALRTLGSARWKKIQQLNYLAFALILGHFFLSQKGTFTILLNGSIFINLAELFLWIMVLLTTLLQVGGFLTKRKRATSPATNALASNLQK